MNINIDLGNVWEALSAVGTIGAVIVSLWLAKREEKSILLVKMSLAFGITTDDRIVDSPFLTIDVFNDSKYPITIEEVGFVKRKNGDKLTVRNSNEFIEGSSGLNFKTDSKTSAMYVLNRDRIQQLAHQKWGNKVKIRAYVRDSSGKKHFSKRHKIW